MEKRYDHYDRKNKVHNDFSTGMEKTKNYMIGNPGNQQPPRPVSATKRENTTNDCEHPDEKDQANFWGGKIFQF